MCIPSTLGEKTVRKNCDWNVPQNIFTRAILSQPIQYVYMCTYTDGSYTQCGYTALSFLHFQLYNINESSLLLTRQVATYITQQ